MWKAAMQDEGHPLGVSRDPSQEQQEQEQQQQQQQQQDTSVEVDLDGVLNLSTSNDGGITYTRAQLDAVMNEEDEDIDEYVPESLRAFVEDVNTKFDRTHESFLSSASNNDRNIKQSYSQEIDPETGEVRLRLELQHDQLQRPAPQQQRQDDFIMSPELTSNVQSKNPTNEMTNSQVKREAMENRLLTPEPAQPQQSTGEQQPESAISVAGSNARTPIECYDVTSKEENSVIDVTLADESAVEAENDQMQQEKEQEQQLELPVVSQPLDPPAINNTTSQEEPSALARAAAASAAAYHSSLSGVAATASPFRKKSTSQQTKATTTTPQHVGEIDETASIGKQRKKNKSKKSPASRDGSRKKAQVVPLPFPEQQQQQELEQRESSQPREPPVKGSFFERVSNKIGERRNKKTPSTSTAAAAPTPEPPQSQPRSANRPPPLSALEQMQESAVMALSFDQREIEGQPPPETPMTSMAQQQHTPQRNSTSPRRQSGSPVRTFQQVTIRPGTSTGDGVTLEVHVSPLSNPSCMEDESPERIGQQQQQQQQQYSQCATPARTVIEDQMSPLTEPTIPSPTKAPMEATRDTVSPSNPFVPEPYSENEPTPTKSKRGGNDRKERAGEELEAVHEEGSINKTPIEQSMSRSGERKERTSRGGNDEEEQAQAVTEQIKPSGASREQRQSSPTPANQKKSSPTATNQKTPSPTNSEQKKSVSSVPEQKKPRSTFSAQINSKPTVQEQKSPETQEQRERSSPEIEERTKSRPAISEQKITSSSIQDHTKSKSESPSQNKTSPSEPEQKKNASAVASKSPPMQATRQEAKKPTTRKTEEAKKSATHAAGTDTKNKRPPTSTQPERDDAKKIAGLGASSRLLQSTASSNQRKVNNSSNNKESKSRASFGTATGKARRESQSITPQNPPPPRPMANKSNFMKGTASTQARKVTPTPTNSPQRPSVSAEQARAKARDRVRQREEQERQKAACRPLVPVNSSSASKSRISADEGIARAKARERARAVREKRTAAARSAKAVGTSSPSRTIRISAEEGIARAKARVRDMQMKQKKDFPEENDRKENDRPRPTTFSGPKFAAPTRTSLSHQSVLKDTPTLAESSAVLQRGLREDTASRVGDTSGKPPRLTIPKGPNFATTRRCGDLMKTPQSRPLSPSELSLSQSTDLYRTGLRDGASVCSRSEHSRSGPTVPHAPNFATTKIYGEKTPSTRGSHSGEFTLACSSQILQHELRTIDPSLMEKRELKLTVPRPPKLHRTSARPRPPSTEEKELQEMEEYKAHPFKARPFIQVEARQDRSLQMPSKRRVTTPVPFQFHSSRGSSDTTDLVPTPLRVVNLDLEESKNQFRALPLPKFVQPPDLSQPQRRKSVTIPRPFSLSSSKRKEDLSLVARRNGATPFRANRVPKSTYSPPSPATGRQRNPSHRSTTGGSATSSFKLPDDTSASERAQRRHVFSEASRKRAEALAREKEFKTKARQKEQHRQNMIKASARTPGIDKLKPFDLSSAQRHLACREKLQEKLKQEEAERRKQAQFRALSFKSPPPPPQSKKSDRHSTSPEPFPLKSVERHQEYEKEAQRKQATDRAEQKKQSTFKAKPLPRSTFEYRPVSPTKRSSVSPSNRPSVSPNTSVPATRRGGSKSQPSNTKTTNGHNDNAGEDSSSFESANVA